MSRFSVSITTAWPTKQNGAEVMELSVSNSVTELLDMRYGYARVFPGCMIFEFAIIMVDYKPWDE